MSPPLAGVTVPVISDVCSNVSTLECAFFVSIVNQFLQLILNQQLELSNNIVIDDIHILNHLILMMRHSIQYKNWKSASKSFKLHRRPFQ